MKQSTFSFSTLIFGLVVGAVLMAMVIPRDITLDTRLFSPETSAEVRGDGGVAIAINGRNNQVTAAIQPPTPDPPARFSGATTAAVGIFILISGAFVGGSLLYISKGGA